MHDLDKSGEKTKGMGFWECFGPVLVMAGAAFILVEAIHYLARGEFIPWK